MPKTDWQQVGEIGVDAGMCWIGDPCYILTDTPTESGAPSYDDLCDKLENANWPKTLQLQYALGHNGVGVVVETGYGDGCYPVYVKLNSEGRVVEVKVVFVTE